MAWYDALFSPLKGIGRTAAAIGKGLADPFYTTDEERMRMALMGSGIDPGGEMDGLAGVRPRLDSTTPGLDILGGIGKTAASFGNQIGRNLPILGPLYQAGEYGVLKGLGREDKPWARGNAFIEKDIRRGQYEDELAYQQDERQHNRNLWPMKEREAGMLAEVSGLQLEEARSRVEGLKARLAAKIAQGGSLVDFETQELKRELDNAQADYDMKQAQIGAEKARGRYYDAGAQNREPAVDPIKKIRDVMETAAMMMGFNPDFVPEASRPAVLQAARRLWESTYPGQPFPNIGMDEDVSPPPEEPPMESTGGGLLGLLGSFFRPDATNAPTMDYLATGGFAASEGIGMLSTEDERGLDQAVSLLGYEDVLRKALANGNNAAVLYLQSKYGK